MSKIILNANDITEISKIIEDYKVDHFTLTRNNISAIGYSIDLEYRTEIKGRMCTVKVPVVGIEEW